MSKYIHKSVIRKFVARIFNGRHPIYGIASTTEIYNRKSKQRAIVGASQDDHNPLDPNDSRAFIIHNDPVRNRTKAMVVEPGELTLTVLQADAEDGTPPLASLQMKDEEKEIYISNGFDGPLSSNAIRLRTDATTMELIDQNEGTSSALEFSKNGLRLFTNGQLVWGVNPDGSMLGGG